MTTHNEMTEPTPEAMQPPGTELLSIDWVPSSERYGEVKHPGAIWFCRTLDLASEARIDEEGILPVAH